MLHRLRDTVHIVLVGVGAAITYGILHDQITIRVSQEYFTVGHPYVLFFAQDPTVIAIGWGILATWWAGLLLAVPAALVAQLGPRPPVSARQLLRPILLSMAMLSVLAALAGGIGLLLAQVGAIWLTAPFARLITPDRHNLFLAAAWSHGASYLGGGVSGIVLWAYTWRVRRRPPSDRAVTAALHEKRPGWEGHLLGFLTTVGMVSLLLVTFFDWLLLTYVRIIGVP